MPGSEAHNIGHCFLEMNMIVMVKTDEVAFAPRKFSHIECDVCGERAPSYKEMHDKGKSLFDLGWFVAPGQHRCSKHFHDDDAPGKPVETRDPAESDDG
jgi:hypothetical protein